MGFICFQFMIKKTSNFLSLEYMNKMRYLSSHLQPDQFNSTLNLNLQHTSHILTHLGQYWVLSGLHGPKTVKDLHLVLCVCKYFCIIV